MRERKTPNACNVRFRAFNYECINLLYDPSTFPERMTKFDWKFTRSDFFVSSHGGTQNRTIILPYTSVYMNFHGNMLVATYSPVQYWFLICRCLARIASESFTYSEVEQHSHWSDAISFYWPFAPGKLLCILQEVIYFLRCSTWLLNKFLTSWQRQSWQQRAMHATKWRKCTE